MKTETLKGFLTATAYRYFGKAPAAALHISLKQQGWGLTTVCDPDGHAWTRIDHPSGGSLYPDSSNPAASYDFLETFIADKALDARRWRDFRTACIRAYQTEP